jgi:hypothetical protein
MAYTIVDRQLIKKRAQQWLKCRGNLHWIMLCSDYIAREQYLLLWLVKPLFCRASWLQFIK